jgi:hypothetical protein
MSLLHKFDTPILGAAILRIVRSHGRRRTIPQGFQTRGRHSIFAGKHLHHRVGSTHREIHVHLQRALWRLYPA